MLLLGLNLKCCVAYHCGTRQQVFFGLRFGIGVSVQQLLVIRNGKCAGQCFAKFGHLVVSAFSQSFGVQRHRNY